jgi:hypothetical protein
MKKFFELIDYVLRRVLIAGVPLRPSSQRLRSVPRDPNLWPAGGLAPSPPQNETTQHRNHGQARMQPHFHLLLMRHCSDQSQLVDFLYLRLSEIVQVRSSDPTGAINRPVAERPARAASPLQIQFARACFSPV